MTFMKSALLGSAAVVAVVAGAQAADLPSKKAAPASYVKICDAYGAGFFYIPGTDTCVKLGGYVRAEYQYVPGQATYSINGLAYNPALATSATNPVPGTPLSLSSVSTGGTATAAAPGSYIQQLTAQQDTTGYEVRGRIDVDARTPTALGTARTFIRVRLTNTSGIRNASPINGAFYAQQANSAAVTVSTGTSNPAGNQILTGSGPTLESAMVQWAGFTFGVAPENYAMMPSFMYNANPWSGFPNGMKQIAYTGTFGGGWSATLALEDMKDQNNNQIVYDQLSTAAAIVGNVRLDQAWGFAALHGAVGNNAAAKNASGAPIITAPSAASGTGFASLSSTGALGQSTSTGWAIGVTASYKLPMIAAGDQIWFTANYASGFLGMLYSTGGLSNVGSTASDHRLMGGVIRVDTNLAPTSTTTVGTTTGWNISAAYTHYWAPQWRSNFTAGYIQVNPKTSTTVWWGTGQLYALTGSIIYSPAKDFDIGLEIQYANVKNKIQNTNLIPNQAWVNAGMPGLNESNVSTKLRVERTF